MPTWIQSIPLPYLIPIVTLLTCILTLPVTILTAWLTVRWTLRRFYAERWWEKKAEAYERAINALFHLRANILDTLAETATGFDSGEAYREERHKASVAARSELTRAAELGAYILSPKATEIAKASLSVDGDLNDVESRLQAALQAITKEARADLKVASHAKR